MRAALEHTRSLSVPTVKGGVELADARLRGGLYLRNVT